MHNIRISILLMLFLGAVYSHAQDSDNSTKQERNHIRSGNAKYNKENFSEAEVSYNKALENNPSSEIARYNLASALMKQSGSAQNDAPENPINKAIPIFKELAEYAQNSNVKENSFYNLGNIAFDQNNYQESIEMYKNALRINPENDKTRENLRLAQLKLKQQQQDKNQDQKQDKQQDKQDQNKDKNKDKNENKEQNQDKQNKQQDKQDQNKDKNKDKNENKEQNQDKQNKQQDKNKDQNNDQQQPQSPEQDKQQKQQQQSQGISDANAEKILKTMENEENATRRKVNEQKKEEERRNASRRPTTNQW